MTGIVRERKGESERERSWALVDKIARHWVCIYMDSIMEMHMIVQIC